MKKLLMIIFLFSYSSIAISNTEVDKNQNLYENQTETYINDLKIIWENIFLRKLEINTDELDKISKIEKYAEHIDNDKLSYTLGVVYMNIPDSVKALKWMKLASKHDHPHAYHNMAWWYDHGFGHIKEDNSKAIEYYTYAFWKLDLARSGGRLSEIYLSGDGADKNEVEARKILEWILEAPELYLDDKDILLAEFKLGQIYRYAIGTEQDLNKAVGYFIEASIKGHDKAMVEAAQIYRNWYRENGDEKANEMAESLYLEAAKKGNTDAMIFLSTIYNEKLNAGIDVARNEVRYISWLYTAYKLGINHKELKPMIEEYMQTDILKNKNLVTVLEANTKDCMDKKFINCF